MWLKERFSLEALHPLEGIINNVGRVIPSEKEGLKLSSPSSKVCITGTKPSET